MSILGTAVAAELNRSTWDENPLLAIGLTPRILQAGLSDDDLFDICQKLARSRLMEVHPDRTNEENEEQRTFSAAFEFLRKRPTFDAALKELRRFANSEERETVRIKRDVKILRELAASSQKHAEEVSRQHRLMLEKYEPLELFVRALIRSQASRVTRPHNLSWSLPGGTTLSGTDKRVVFALMWAHTALKEGARETTVEDVIADLARKAKKDGGYPWEVIGESINRSRYEKHYADAVVPKEVQGRCESDYPDALDSLLDLCVGIRHKRLERKVVADELVVGLRSSLMMADATLLMSAVGKVNRYKIFGSYRPPKNSHDYPELKFGTSGFVEMSLETVVQAASKKSFSTALVPGWLMLGMQVRDLPGEDNMGPRPTAVQFSNMHQNPFLVLGSLIAVA